MWKWRSLIGQLKAKHSVKDYCINGKYTFWHKRTKQKDSQTKIYVDSGRVLQKNHCSDNLLLLCILSKMRSSVYRQQLLVAIMMHLSQQLSGINAVSGKYISTLPLSVPRSVY